MAVNTQEVHRISAYLVVSAKMDVPEKVVCSGNICWTRVCKRVSVKLNLVAIISKAKHHMKRKCLCNEVSILLEASRFCLRNY
jgi:hypothetical protein